MTSAQHANTNNTAVTATTDEVPPDPWQVHHDRWNATAAGDDGDGWLPVEGRRRRPDPVAVIVVDNPTDEAAAARHLAALTTPYAAHSGRVIVRPTPGATDTGTLGLDVLAAVGKNPSAAKTERVTHASWDIAVAWLRGMNITDLVVDRVHRLTGEQLRAVTRLACAAGATLWLICSGPPQTAEGIDLATLVQAAALQGAARPTFDQISLAEFITALPAPAPRPQDHDRSSRKQQIAAASRTWPALPTADFLTFLAEARRMLPGSVFTDVEEAYFTVAEQTEAWLEDHQNLIKPGEEYAGDLEAALTGWLRDHILGPAPTAPVALVSLRAIQAALFTEGYFLAWDSESLGPDPARRLPGTLTPSLGRALQTMCRTYAAAATALSLHLNHGPAHFDLIRCEDVAPDGSLIRNAGAHIYTPPPYTSVRWNSSWGPQRTPDTAYREMTGPRAIHIPPTARPVIAAHLAWRLRETGPESAPLFRHPTQPHIRPPTQILREAIARTCRRLGVRAPWVHSGDCKYGTDINQAGRTQSWMTQRGLALHPMPL